MTGHLPNVTLNVIAGPTASGKSKLALDLALATGAEIVSADSQQVYRHFDIGTAKPTREELAAVPHHLISVVDPLADFSAAQFQKLADEAILSIAARGCSVVVVGGTGLYLRILLRGIIAAPARDEALRAQFEALADSEGNEALHRRLNAVDPDEARRLPPSDRVRIIRALEIHALTGQTATSLRAAHQFDQPRYPYRLWVLSPDRDALYQRINDRTRAMFEGGLLEEVAVLIRNGYGEAAPMRSVGYVQAKAAIDGTMSVDQARDAAAQATRHYAKRQITWFKKEQGAVFVSPEIDVRQLIEPII